MGKKNTFVLSGGVNATRYNELRGFDKLGINVAANYNYKWPLGAYAPVLSLSSSYAFEEYEGRANLSLVASKKQYPLNKREHNWNPA